jgi:hypothetical protein
MSHSPICLIAREGLRSFLAVHRSFEDARRLPAGVFVHSVEE